jgi:hypothetical protein
LQALEIFTASMTDIEKILKSKTRTDPQTKLPSHYHKFLEIFDQAEAEKLPPLCRPDMDHQIKLVSDKNRRTPNLS